MSNLQLDPQSHQGWELALPDGQPNNSTSNVYEAFRQVGAGYCRLFGFAAYSSNASAQFFLVFDSLTKPANGAIPKMIFPVGATSAVGVYYGSIGRAFFNGIFVCNSSTGPTLTIGSADSWFDVQWL